MATKAGAVYIDIRGSDKDLKGDLDKAHGKITSSAKSMQSQVSRAFKIMSVAAVASLAAISYGLIKLTKESALLAARFETMGVVMHNVGANAGYSAAQMDEFDISLRKTGISMIESRSSLTKMAQAQLDLTKATQLGRIAQDAAVIGGINSSEAFGRMIDGIQSGRVMILKTIGINVNFANSYKKVAEETGRAVSSFTEAEKTIIRQNTVLAYGSRIAGTYEAAMTTAGKKLLSFTRYVEDFKVKMGLAFGPAMVVLIDGATIAMKQMQIEISKPETQEALRNISMHLSEIVLDLSTDIPGKFKKIQSSLEGIVGIYNSLPEGVIGAAGAGMIGKMLFGSAGAGGVVASLYYINQLLERDLNSGLQSIGEKGAAVNQAFIDLYYAVKQTVTGVKEFNFETGKLFEEENAIARLKAIEDAHQAMVESAKVQTEALAALSDVVKVTEKTKEQLAAIAAIKDEYNKLTMSAQTYAELKLKEEYDARAAAAGGYTDTLNKLYELKKAMILQDENVPAETSAKFFKESHRKEYSVSMEMSGIDPDAINEIYRQIEEDKLAIREEFNMKYAEMGKTEFELERERVQRMMEIYREAGVEENKIVEMTKQRNLEIARAEHSAKLDMYKNIAGGISDTFQMIAQAGGEQSKKAFQMQKAFAIVEAGINVYQGVTKALAQGGVMGFVNGALVAAAGAAQISMIANSQPPSYDQGGVSDAAGVYQTGPIKEAHVPIPSGKIPVTINNDSAGGQSSAQEPPQINVKNILVQSPDIVGDYLDTTEGEQVIVTIMQRNRAIMEN